MTLDDYRILKEIESHKANLLRLRQSNDSENARLTKIDQTVHDRENEKASNEAALKELRIELQSFESELETSQSNKQKSEERAASLPDENQITANQKQIEAMILRIAELEPQIFTKMEVIEEIESKITDATTFLAGIPKTRSEIQGDVDEVVSANDKEISNHQKQIKSLLDTLPKELRESFMRVHKKFAGKVAISELRAENCSICGFEVTKSLMTEINSLREIANCRSCGRLIIPHDL